MGLIEHIIPSIFLTLLGLWHTMNTTKSYHLHGPSNFTSKTWFPFPKIKHLELYLLIIFSVTAISYNLIYVSTLPVPSLQHATMFLHFGIFAVVALVVDCWLGNDAWAPVVGVLAASAFGQEWFLLHFHEHGGLEGHYHWLMQLIVTASFASATATVFLPSSFAAAIIRSSTITCQGLWFAVMGCILYLPILLPQGCHVTDTPNVRLLGTVTCVTQDATRAAVAAANLNLSWTIAGVSVVTVVFCLRHVGKLEYCQLESVKVCDT